jgi:hypothetical protein
MRKLLLAGAAFVGSVGVASAQTAMPMAPTQGGVTQYNAIMAGNNQNNSDGSPLPANANAPTPGSVVIHLNGRVNVYAAVSGGSLNTYLGNKTAPDQFLGYFRLYPGMDALATNGLRYGGIVEIRQNFIGNTLGLTFAAATTGASNGAGSNFSNSPSGSSCASTLYVRREAIYFGSNELGIVRVGQDDGPFSQFDGGVTTFQNFNDGAWNGDLPGAVIGNSQPTFPFWSGVGAEYTIEKAVYFTPNFAGFDAAISFAPNNATTNDSACGVAGSGCANTSTATDSNFGGGSRPTNMFEVMGRYRGTVGPVGLYGIAGYAGSGHTNDTAAVSTSNAKYNNFSVGDFGLVATVAGLSVGGNVLFGQYDGQVALQPQGGKQAIAWIAGAQYVTGPFTMGVSYFNYQSAGSPKTLGTTQRYDDGLAAGGTYSVAPGMVVYLSYLYGQVHQGGINLATGGTGSAYNDVHSQAFSIGTRVFW